MNIFPWCWTTTLFIFSNYKKHVGVLALNENCRNSKERNSMSDDYPECVTESISLCQRKREENTLLKDVRVAFQNLAEQMDSRLLPRNCWDLQQRGDNITGVRTIYPFTLNPNRRVRVFCDQTTDGGGWTVFQHRENLQPRENFFRKWNEYRLGFGKLDGEFWLGLENIHALVSETLMELRIDLENYENERRWAKYDYFYIGNVDEEYKLDYGKYSGDAGDGMVTHNAHKFSTTDHDNDVSSGSCATKYKGAWWYEKCHDSNLNGFPYVGKHDSDADGINWKPFTGYHYSLKKTSMALRPRFSY